MRDIIINDHTSQVTSRDRNISRNQRERERIEKLSRSLAKTNSESIDYKSE
jgi:hypothetical protein